MSKRRKKTRSKITPIILIVIVLALFGYYWLSEKENTKPLPADSCLVMRVIDVGQGDSILIGCDNEYMLVDCGEKEEASRVLEQIKGIDKLKYLVATHPHTDHMGGVATVLENCDVELFIMPEKEHTTKAFEEMLDTIEKTDTEATYAYAGDKYELGNAQITVISPEEGYSDSNLNNWSVVLLVQYGDTEILLTGDSEVKMEKEYLKYIKGPIEIYKAAHHGSDTSNSEELLSVIRPTYTAISCGAGNKYGHPIPEIVKRIEKYCDNIYRTDKDGHITFTIKEGEITVETQR
jgi:beta-lactamase superfamily II metal-dependent hydrolase